jgi:hypothetical protein
MTIETLLSSESKPGKRNEKGVRRNFTHLANGFIIRELKKINLNLGVQTPEICTPEELMEVFNEG